MDYIKISCLVLIVILSLFIINRSRLLFDPENTLKEQGITSEMEGLSFFTKECDKIMYCAIGIIILSIILFYLCSVDYTKISCLVLIAILSLFIINRSRFLYNFEKQNIPRDEQKSKYEGACNHIMYSSIGIIVLSIILFYLCYKN